MKNKIGIMGGTFNPIHNGHLMLANEAFIQFQLHKVLIMVSPTPPHKPGSDIISASHRANMARLAAIEYPDRFQFSDFELKRSGYIYTADTLTQLCDLYPDNEYYFIIGGDSLKNLEKWYKPEIVMKKAVILAAVRDTFDASQAVEHINYLNRKYEADIRLLKTTDMPVSSTMLRNMVASGQSINEYVPKSVEDYISEHKLYVTA